MKLKWYQRLFEYLGIKYYPDTTCLCGHPYSEHYGVPGCHHHYVPGSGDVCGCTRFIKEIS